MKEYETIVVMRPDGPESQTKEILDKIDGIIKSRGGTILQQKNWGKRELAYRIMKYNQGVYYYYNYAGESGVVAELERSLKLNDLPMRYLTVKIADDVDAEARMREIASMKEEVKPAEITGTKENAVSEEVKDA